MIQDFSLFSVCSFAGFALEAREILKDLSLPQHVRLEDLLCDGMPLCEIMEVFYTAICPC